MEQSYKEKYEQAIERLKQWDREHHCAGYVLSDRDKFIFPELAENKDEKVRKALLEMVHDTTGDELWIDYNVHKEEALDWLERQGEHANFRNKIQVGDKVTRNENGVLVNLSQLRRVAKPSEKQGEQEKDIMEDAILDGNEDGLIAETIRYKNEKRGGQKPADTVEPKFKVGDWVANDYCVGKVIELTDDAYLLDTGQGIPFSCEHNAHLWTIQDAKDGDVLCLYYNNRKTFFIFKAIIGEGDYADILVHCCYTGKYQYLEPSFNGECRMHQISDGGYFLPADKEEQDILFQKMHEAGYVWDAEKKELKKISQRMVSAEAKEAMYDKPADTVEPKFKVGDKIYLKPEYRMPDDDTPIANTVKEIRRIDDKHYRFDGSYIFIEDQDKYELVEQKPEENNGNIGGIPANWSEEDEKNLRRAIRATKVVYPVAADWLQSLQDRVQPKPMCKFGDTELTNEELCEGLIRGMINEHNRVTKEILRNEYEKGRADVLAKIDAIDVDEMVCESGATSRVTQYWYAHGVNDVIKKLKEEQV